MAHHCRRQTSSEALRDAALSLASSLEGQLRSGFLKGEERSPYCRQAYQAGVVPETKAVAAKRKVPPSPHAAQVGVEESAMRRLLTATVQIVLPGPPRWGLQTLRAGVSRRRMCVAVAK